MNALQLCDDGYTQRNFIADLLLEKCTFIRKILRFDLGLIGKRVMDFLLVML